MPQTFGDVESDFFVHLFDVGPEKYGDAVLCRFGNKTVLIDGGHPGNDRARSGHPPLQSQIADVLQQPENALRVDLLIVTHAHSDHIGCLPSLVTGGLRPRFALVADPKLGWGRGMNENGDSLADLQSPAKRLSAALREELHTRDEPPGQLQDFIDAVAQLEPAYNGMIDTLSASEDTAIVRYIGPQSQGLDKLLTEFQDIGLSILGPGEEQLRACAVGVRGRSKEFGDMAAKAEGLNSDSDVISAYLRATGSADRDFTDSQGAFINCQSVVTVFEFRGKRLLFTGDMQLSVPGVTPKGVLDGVTGLNQSIRKNGPYSLVKLAHHGSKNGFSAKILEDTGCHTFAMCGGSETDPAHPDPSVLQLLEGQSSTHWARTDRNGQSRFTFTGAAAPSIEVDTPPKDNAEPNSADVGGPAPLSAVPVTLPPAPAAEAASAVSATQDGVVRVTAEFPASLRRVVITVDVNPGAEPEKGPTRPFDSAPATLKLAGGRPLPKLLFVTNRDALVRNTNQAAVSSVFQAIQSAGHTLIANVPSTWSDPSGAVAGVRNELRRGGYAGVVLLGGYDVVPSKQLDCLPDRLRAVLGHDSADADDFIVWSDDIYGDIEGDGIPELPVSRIPDGCHAPLLLRAIQADGVNRSASRAALRNVARPFADRVFGGVSGVGNMLRSTPATSGSVDQNFFGADRIYLMLHGSNLDGTRFWGEHTPGNAAAMGLADIPQVAGTVIFTGCCWGGLIVDTIAKDAAPPSAPAPGSRTVDNSIALKFLMNGANAFIGCTGEHYSPSDGPQLYFGGPMHIAFWKAYCGGAPPARALWQAKKEYAPPCRMGRQIRSRKGSSSRFSVSIRVSD